MASETLTSRTIITIAVVGLAGYFLYLVRDILMPFIVSGIFAYLLSPFVERLQSTGLRRVYAVMIIYIVLLGSLAIGLMAVIPQVVQEARHLQDNLPEVVGWIRTALINFQADVEARFPILRENAVIENALTQIGQFLSKGLAGIPSYAAGLFSFFSLLFLIPVITFFIMLTGRGPVDWLVEILPARHVETGLSIFWEIDEVLGRFVRGQVVEAAAVAVISIVGLTVIGVKYAYLIGIVAGVANVIPYLGPIVGGFIGILAGIMQYQNLAIVPKVILVFIIVQVMDNNFIQPIVLSRGVNLNPVIVMFAIMAGAQIYGIIGMLLAVPLAAMLKTTIDIFIGKKG